MASKSRTAADRQRAADVRDWAAANSLTVAERGRIPAAVYAAYDAAIAADPDEPEPGPDWAAAGVPLDLDEPDPELEPDPGAEPPGAAAAAAAGNGSAPAPEPAAPPPASLDDARERLGSGARRLPPPWAGARGGGGSQRPAPAAPVKVTPKVTNDIRGKLALLLAIPAATWSAVDPACGGAFAEQLDTIVDKATPLICMSPEAVKWFTEGTIYLLWIDLLMALMPVANMVYKHHLAGTITVVNGRPVPATRLPSGRVVPADQVTPGRAEPDWTAYTTDLPGHVPPPRSA